MVPYPDDNFKLGRYLGPSIDISPALMAKIIKENGEVFYWSIYGALTQEDWKQEECKAKGCSF